MTRGPDLRQRKKRADSGRVSWPLFFSHIALPDENNCMEWVGPAGEATLGFKYGRHGARTAHRMAYEYWHGPIPHGLVIDHVYAWGCRSTLCCAPDHLEAVTQAENVARGHKGALFTHCQSGHEMTSANTYVRKDGRGRQCRRCKADRERIRQRALKEAG
ncbi:HNH endonuclease signature motif containing protein [Actinomadura rubrisoli]|uniref:HNH endonuclease n=1 Tax=Actinomadura rubrisoli TaxID=2530368 RepID=A0A4V2YZK8_9ACTN|nr:HNH endonuclease signature motif containing protein [Actinomadura rubrisoli]TDD97657.1 HNH endonuclease [Actinomadura rubrisoli]